MKELVTAGILGNKGGMMRKIRMGEGVGVKKGKRKERREKHT